MVGGTNGKGSTCAMLESILLQAGYKVGLYIKPHFLRLQRARPHRPARSPATMRWSTASTRWKRRAATSSLTYFEFTTLAIMHLFAQARAGRGHPRSGPGRTARCGQRDRRRCRHRHQRRHRPYRIPGRHARADRLREGRHLPRRASPAICSDPVPPQSLIDHAEEIGADLWLLGRDFNYSGDKQQWNYGGRSAAPQCAGLPGPARRQPVAQRLAPRWPRWKRCATAAAGGRAGSAHRAWRWSNCRAASRCCRAGPTVILDVAHNPHAAAALAQNLGNMGFHPYTYAVFGVMQDKDIDGVIAHMAPLVDHWCVADLPSPRAASAGAACRKAVRSRRRAAAQQTPNTASPRFASPGRSLCKCEEQGRRE